jgi:hypothetical protein
MEQSMIKMPYDLVALQANHLLELAIVALDFQDRRTYLDQYCEFLNATGWTDEEFDQATLERVDGGWDNVAPFILKTEKQWS